MTLKRPHNDLETYYHYNIDPKSPQNKYQHRQDGYQIKTHISNSQGKFILEAIEFWYDLQN